jgi:hypothetical protein
MPGLRGFASQAASRPANHENSKSDNCVTIHASAPQSKPIFDPPRPHNEHHRPGRKELAKTLGIVPIALIYRCLHSSPPSNPPSRFRAGGLTGPPCESIKGPMLIKSVKKGKKGLDFVQIFKYKRAAGKKVGTYKP